MKTFLILIFISALILPYQTLKSQTDNVNYCSTNEKDAKKLIGRPAKIYETGGIYPTINDGDFLKWPSEEMRKKGGESGWGTYDPEVGDTGTIAHIFFSKAYDRPLYLLKIRQYYVVIGCSDVTDINLPDMHQHSRQMWIDDSIANLKYAAGCKFKIQNVNNRWSRTGLTKLDRQSEDFACELITKGIDTVMLCKYLSGNGSSAYERAFILWLEDGKGYVKSFFNNVNHEPTNNKVQPFDSKQLIDHFFINRLDTVTTVPKRSLLSHPMGLNIQLYTTDYFFRQQLDIFSFREDTTNPKAIWWHMISDKLEVLKPE